MSDAVVTWLMVIGIVIFCAVVLGAAWALFCFGVRVIRGILDI